MSDLAVRRRAKYENSQCESIVLEISFGKEKWAYSAAYKPPSLPDKTFTTNFTSKLEDLTADYDNMIVMGDLNFDLRRNTSKNPIALINIMDSFDLVNLVKDLTCIRQYPPSLLDFILTNKPKSFQRTITIEDGISDFHSTVCTTMKVHIENKTKKILHCRSYTIFTKKRCFERHKINEGSKCSHKTIY